MGEVITDCIIAAVDSFEAPPAPTVLPQTLSRDLSENMDPNLSHKEIPFWRSLDTFPAL